MRPESIPIVLFTYNRPRHAEQVLEALRAIGARKIYAFSDGPRTPEDESRVAEVRKVLRSAEGLEIQLTEREENLGLARSILQGVEAVLESNEAAIILEDDCVPGPGFLEFMTSALDRYRDDDRIASVSGYALPIEIPEDYPYDAYIVPRISSWGWGTWRRAWRRGIRKDLPAAVAEARSKSIDLDAGGSDFSALINQALEANGKRDIWTPLWGTGTLIEGMQTVWPTRSHVKNIGFDRSGQNCGSGDRYEVDLSVQRSGFRLPPVVPVDPILLGRFRKFLDNGAGPTRRRVRLSSDQERDAENWRRNKPSWFEPERSHLLALARAMEELFLSFPPKAFERAIDFGCGSRPYRHFIDYVAREQVALDIGENPAADIQLPPDGKAPLPDASADLLGSFQVLEHVEDDHAYLAEIARILQEGGTLVLSVPSVWPYHPHPQDYRRWMIDGLKADLARHGLRVTQVYPILNPFSTGIQYLLSLVRYTLWWRGLIGRTVARAIALPCNLLIAMSERFLKRSLYYGAGNYVVVAIREPRTKEKAE